MAITQWVLKPLYGMTLRMQVDGSVVLMFDSTQKEAAYQWLETLLINARNAEVERAVPPTDPAPPPANPVIMPPEQMLRQPALPKILDPSIPPEVQLAARNPNPPLDLQNATVIPVGAGNVAQMQTFNVPPPPIVNAGGETVDAKLCSTQLTPGDNCVLLQSHKGEHRYQSEFKAKTPDTLNAMAAVSRNNEADRQARESVAPCPEFGCIGIAGHKTPHEFKPETIESD